MRRQEGKRTNVPVEGVSYRGVRAHSSKAVGEEAVYVQGFKSRQVVDVEMGACEKTSPALLNERK